jgi:hypothetical protein
MHELLAELQAQLRTAPTGDAASRRLLERLDDDVRALIAAGPKPAAAAEDPGLRGRFADAVLAFEGSHPELSRTLESLVDTLGQHTL